MIGMSTRSRLALTAALSVLTAGAAAQPPDNVDDVLARTAVRVAQYFTRAQSIVFFEKATVQPVRGDMSPEGFARVLESDLRVEWDPTSDGDAASEAKVLRELRKVNGHPPRAKDDRNCLDPNPISPEPLAFLMPAERGDYAFTLAGRGKGKEQHTVMVDFRSLETGQPEMKHQPGKHEGCFSVTIPGRIKGRVWIDATTYEVLRVDQQLTGRIDYRVPNAHVRRGMAEVLVIERYDMSIRYKPIAFHDPEEIVLLPQSIETLTIYRGAQSHRSRQVFSNYRRFMTGGRVVK